MTNRFFNLAGGGRTGCSSYNPLSQTQRRQRFNFSLSYIAACAVWFTLAAIWFVRISTH